MLENQNARIVIECKRQKDGQWVFPVDAGATAEKTAFRYLELRRGYREFSGWADERLIPASYEVEFCAVRGQSGDRGTPMRERVSHDLLEAIEALAFADVESLEDQTLIRRAYVPMVVTNAPLIIARMDVGAVSLDGDLPAEAEFESVDFLRFRKTLVFPDLPGAADTDIPEIQVAGEYGADAPDTERSIFVVRLGALAEFLGTLSMSGDLR